LKLPPLDLMVAINRAVRDNDEWIDEPDDLERVQRADQSPADRYRPHRGWRQATFESRS